MNPLDAKHHLRFEDDCEYREGVVNANKNDKSFVYIGLKKEALINQLVEPGTRVTVQLDIFEEKNYFNGKVVSPNLPKQQLGIYWGYEVRVAPSLSSALRESPFGMPYDLTIGTSDRGDMLDSVSDSLPDFRHALIVFGGLKGIESAHEADESLKDIKDAKEMFNFYLNTCPKQGTNTIRTEEAMLISMASLRTALFS
jgi:predicted SPOUT superfamily RNA methylase MTH1